MSFLLNHNYRFYMNDLLAGADNVTRKRIAKGITSVDPDNNEESDETYYYDGGGAAERDVIGYMLSYAFEGHRNYGDPAQDDIMSLATRTGPDRKIFFTVEEPDGTVLQGPATVSDISLPGGDANSKGEISFTISFDGTPTIIDPSPYPPLNDAPSNLRQGSVAVTQNSVSLSFDFSKPITTHKIVFDVLVDGVVSKTVADGNDVEITSLSADTEYKLSVQAKYQDKDDIKSPLSNEFAISTII